MNIMEVWTIENNRRTESITEDYYMVAVRHFFEDKNVGNKFFKLCQQASKPMITRNNETIRYWNSQKEDWLAPMIRAGIKTYVWRNDRVQFDILSYAYELEKDGVLHTLDGTFAVERRIIRHYDVYLAEAFDLKEKWVEFIFIDEDGNDLSSVGYEI